MVTYRYHGLAFDGSGARVANPHGPAVSAQSVRSWPVRDAYAIRTFRPHDFASNATITERRRWIFANEDKSMIEAQQRRIGDAGLWALKPVLVKTDHATVVVRRLMAGLIAGEQGMTA